MGKKEDKKLGRFFIILAAASAVITLLEGVYYYHPEEYANPLFRWMMIFQNTIKAFGFRSEIGLREVVKKFGESRGMFETAVDYTYTFAVFTAPYCTLTVVYKVLESLFRFRILPDFLWKKHVHVFGYNEDVKVLLKEKQKKYRIHLVTPELPKEDEMELLRRGIKVHLLDCLQLSESQQNHYLKRLKLKKAQVIILFEESAAKNFFLYQMFHKAESEKLLSDDVKFFSRCEDESMKWLMEEYYNSHRTKKNEDTGETKQWVRDLEIVSLTELRIRKMLEEHPLHGYYLDDNKEPAADVIREKKTPKMLAEEMKCWNLHLLIVGFGKLGQQLLLQAMNMGVVSSENKILIDVVDFRIEEKKSIFANNFHENYVDISNHEMKIPSTKADGELNIRFHQMDIRYKQFFELLCKNGSVENGGPYTYVAICVEDMDVGLHCMLEMDRYMQQCMEKEQASRVNIGIRMEFNRQMADYLRESHSEDKRIFVIAETQDSVSMEQLIEDSLTMEAKRFNYIYSTLTVQSKEAYEEMQKEKTIASSKQPVVPVVRKVRRKKQEDENIWEAEKKYWSGMVMFKRNSNRAVAQHGKVRKLWMERFDYVELKKQLDAFGVIYQKESDVWTFTCSEEEMVRRQSDRNSYPLISEISRMEHRRWCYYMASLGWKRTEEPGGKKDETKEERKERERRKENACLCNWDDLVKHKRDMCKYDLMPLLMEYEGKEP